MTRGTRYSSVLFLTAALGLGLTQCSSSEPWAVENTGRAAAEITVPSGVQCIQITVAGGGTTVTDLFPVTSNQGATLPLNGLPVGTDTFVGAAFSVACPSIAMAVPTWVTSPVVSNVMANAPFSVALTFVPNGHGSVTTSFADAGDAGGGLPNTVSCDSTGCVCSPGFANCNGSWTDGCEANVASDPANCGACGNACSSGGACMAGACTGSMPVTCPSGQRVCSITNACIPSSSCCTSSDCTVSGTACTGPGGTCACMAGLKLCSVSGTCIASGACCTSADCAMGKSCTGPGGSCN